MTVKKFSTQTLYPKLTKSFWCLNQFKLRPFPSVDQVSLKVDSCVKPALIVAEVVLKRSFPKSSKVVLVPKLKQTVSQRPLFWRCIFIIANMRRWWHDMMQIHFNLNAPTATRWSKYLVFNFWRPDFSFDGLFFLIFYVSSIDWGCRNTWIDYDGWSSIPESWFSKASI